MKPAAAHPLAIGHACASDVGKVRSENQDAWFADPGAGLYLVADGMGGHNAGGMAANAVARGLPGKLGPRLGALAKPPERAIRAVIQDVVADFSADLRERAKAEPSLKGMGATLALLLIRAPFVFTTHLGDSRVYILERAHLKRIGTDHSVVAVMLELGKITPEQAKVHPFRHSLSRYMGMDGKAVADVHKVDFKGTGRFLLCSDGLTNMLPDTRIAAALAEENTPAEASRRLVEEANAAGGEDNVTALVVDVSDGR